MASLTDRLLGILAETFVIIKVDFMPYHVFLIFFLVGFSIRLVVV